MKKGLKLIAGLAAVAAVMMSAADAGAVIGGASGDAFVGVVSSSASPLVVNCMPGDVTAKSTTKISLGISNATAGASSIGSLGNATRVKATWPGGSVWITKAGSLFKTSSSVQFPCPAAGTTSAFSVAFQPYRGGKLIGASASVNVSVSNTGPAEVRKFAAWPNVNPIDLSCAPGTKAKTSSVLKLVVSNTIPAGINPDLLGDDLARATSYRATWNGGSVVITRQDREFRVSGGAKFVCPDPHKPGSQTNVITVQGYRGSLKVGKAAHINLGLFNTSAPGSQASSNPNTPPGGTVGSTNEASSTDPVNAMVDLPDGIGGSVTIKESPWPTALPATYTTVGASVNIDAPVATDPNHPLVLKFRLNAPGFNPATLAVFRGGVGPIAACASAGVANPDPCVAGRQQIGDDIVITVNTMHASPWDFGKPNGSPS